MITTQVGNVVFSVRESHDFRWLEELGEVFTVFDQQDSGNLSFGIVIDGVKRFVKYAGAKPIAYKGDPEDAIERLKNAVSVYIDLKHEYLVNMVDHYPVADGYAVIFDWFEGESLHAHWLYPPPEKYNNPLSPNVRYRNLSTKQLLLSLGSILSFHQHVEQAGYVAVDFYDGSLLYDFNTYTTKICDIDYYQKKLFTNQMGRMYGSSRFMSPEEFILHSPIDERTNVFNMGATLFALAGGELDRSFDKWRLSRQLYDIACKAVRPEREQRYASVAEMYDVWRSAAQ